MEVAIDIGDRSTETNYGMPLIVKKRLGELPGKPFDVRSSVTIFRLPYHINSKELCQPKVVSIGPYHRGKESLRNMEEHKWFMLRDFLARNETVGIECYYQAMKSIESQTRQCFSETVDLGSDDFVMMLLLDGCFILEWFLKTANAQKDSTCWNLMDIFCDLCLMENQVPFSVIHTLWATQELGMGWQSLNCQDHCSLASLVHQIFERYSHVSIGFERPYELCTNIRHLLHLYVAGTTSMFGCQPQTQSKQRNLFTLEIDYIPNAAYLTNAGVRFRRKTKCIPMLDISFKQRIIEMPVIKLDTHFVRILWNMVALEQIGVGWAPSKKLSSYLALMDLLIDTDKDVAILEEAGIVESYFPDADTAAAFFNQFRNYFILDYSDHNFYSLFKDIREYCNTPFTRYRARLMKDYFGDAWGFLTATVFVLTVAQTIAAFKAFF